jgi:NAD(P)-dependent dehydrogenase (short-subunit alcohol dehydrogenase family)
MPSVLITSASRGLGFEFARQYAADGWKVFAACRDPQAPDRLQGLKKSGEIRTLQMDVTSAESVHGAAAEINDEAIDVLINSAGIIGAPNQTVGSVDYDSWAKVLNVNTMGPLRVIEAFTEHVARSSRKLIVTITSGMGSLADNTSGGSIAYRSLPLGEPVKGLSGNELPRDLPLERDAVRTLSGHGFHFSKAQHSLSNH